MPEAFPAGATAAQRTPPCAGTCNPRWEKGNEFCLPLAGVVSARQLLDTEACVVVSLRDTSETAEFELGRAAVPLGTLVETGSEMPKTRSIHLTAHWLPLERGENMPKASGRVKLSLVLFCGDAETSPVSFDERARVVGCLAGGQGTRAIGKMRVPEVTARGAAASRLPRPLRAPHERALVAALD